MASVFPNRVWEQDEMTLAQIETEFLRQVCSQTEFGNKMNKMNKMKNEI